MRGKQRVAANRSAGRAGSGSDAGGRQGKRWSQHVAETSDALDLQRGLFAKKDARGVALSLKRSAERSRRRKGTPYQSAMSMLNFFINRAGKQLGTGRKRVLERAKDELRALFHRPQEA